MAAHPRPPRCANEPGLRAALPMTQQTAARRALGGGEPPPPPAGAPAPPRAQPPGAAPPQTRRGGRARPAGPARTPRIAPRPRRPQHPRSRSSRGGAGAGRGAPRRGPADDITAGLRRRARTWLRRLRRPPAAPGPERPAPSRGATCPSAPSAGLRPGAPSLPSDRAAASLALRGRIAGEPGDRGRPGAGGRPQGAGGSLRAVLPPPPTPSPPRPDRRGWGFGECSRVARRFPDSAATAVRHRIPIHCAEGTEEKSGSLP
ncbi:BEN domain-containing protein 6 isoform X2 [Odocoileus virginianus]|uniref:BEN domain-containing protein 6 isoform X2 n=1 Tax=Odocoileus virginianus TaxID=9874 RepID=A0ABM4HB81_ODOVR